MTHYELCPVCYRLGTRLVDQALDMTAAITNGEFPAICDAHLPLVFSTLSYRTMAQWLEAMLDRGPSSDPCSLCVTETDVTITPAEASNDFLCARHGGVRPENVALIRKHLARIAAGERFDQERFVLRAALILHASVRGTAPMVRIE